MTTLLSVHALYSGFMNSCNKKNYKPQTTRIILLDHRIWIEMAICKSCEPKCCSDYSDDLQWRKVYQHEALGLTCDSIQMNLCVDPSTVGRNVQLFRRTGQVNKKTYNATNLPCQLTDTILLQLVLVHPGIKLHKIQAETEHVTGVELAASTICQFLHSSGFFSRQRMRLAASQGDEDLRADLQVNCVSRVLTCSSFLDENTQFTDYAQCFVIARCHETTV